MMINQPTAVLPVRARVSILERLAPGLSFALVAVSGAAGAVAMQRFFRAMSVAENAGYLAYYIGMAEVHMVITVILVLAVLIGFAGILVAVIRMITTNQTASPPGAVFLIPAGISLISPLLTGYAGATANLALDGRGGLSEVFATITILNWAAIGVAFFTLCVLLVFTFVPFRSKTGRKFTPVLFLVLIQGGMVAAAIAFFLEMRFCWSLAEAHY